MTHCTRLATTSLLISADVHGRDVDHRNSVIACQGLTKVAPQSVKAELQTKVEA